jgi:pimeloyl-ACP methyl ester carboxylesterase
MRRCGALSLKIPISIPRVCPADRTLGSSLPERAIGGCPPDRALGTVAPGRELDSGRASIRARARRKRDRGRSLLPVLVEGADGVRLALEDSGDGPVVVLLHGLTATRHYVVMGSTHLQRSGYRVIAYDARAHGESDPAPSPDAYTYPDLVADLHALLDRLGVERALLAGASMGAHSALAFALSQPRRVSALALITPAFDPAAGAAQEAASWARWDALAAGLRDGGVEGFLAAYEASRIAQPFRETVIRVIRQRLAAHANLGALADALQALPRSRPFEDFAQLATLDLPVLVVGSRDEADPGHPLEIAERYADAIPGAQLLVEEPPPPLRSPIAWQGGHLSRAIAALAAIATP